MYNGSDVRFIDAHPECNSGHYALQLIPQEPVVGVLSEARRQTSMIAFTLHSSIYISWPTGKLGQTVIKSGRPISKWATNNCAIYRILLICDLAKMCRTFQ